MKPFKMKMNRRREWIVALNKLLKMHESALKCELSYDDYKRINRLCCPLCDTVKNSCIECVWVIFTGFGCSQGDWDYNNSAERIPVIKEWIRLLKERES